MFSQKIELFNSVEYNKRVLFIVWILVLSKCLILEYYIRDLVIPINSTFFIWCLSLLLTSLASYLFLKQSNSLKISQDEKLKVRILANVTIFMILVVLNSTNLFFVYLHWPYLMATNLALLGIYFLVNGWLKVDRWNFITGAYLLLSSAFVSQCEFLSVYLYSSFLLIILAIQLIVDLIHYRRTSINTE